MANLCRDMRQRFSAKCYILQEMHLKCVFQMVVASHQELFICSRMITLSRAYTTNPCPAKQRQGLEGQLFCAPHKVQDEGQMTKRTRGVGVSPFPSKLDNFAHRSITNKSRSIKQMSAQNATLIVDNFKCSLYVSQKFKFIFTLTLILYFILPLT